MQKSIYLFSFKSYIDFMAAMCYNFLVKIFSLGGHYGKITGTQRCKL